MLKHILKQKGRRIYRGRYRLPGDSKITEISLKTDDKRVAQKRLDDLYDQLQHEAAGIIAPKPLRDAAQKTLLDHLADYTNDLTALGRDSMYVYNIEHTVSRLINECGWVLPKDATADSFQIWRGKQSHAPKTLNEYLAGMNGLLNWMLKHGRLVANPLRNVSLVEVRGREQRKRRSLTHEEANRLLAVAGPFGIVYLAALLSGLRRGELEQLVWADLILDVPAPYLIVRASTAKNHKQMSLPLHSKLAKALRAYRPSTATATELVFPNMPTMYRLKAHLNAAGIPYIDDQGRQADFHALRHSFATHLSMKNVSPRMAMEAMRHSDMRLTMKNYTDVSCLPTAAAIESLPGYDLDCSQLCSQKMFPDCLGLTQAGKVNNQGASAQSIDSKDDCRSLAEAVSD